MDTFLHKQDESLYEKIAPQVRRLITEYRQAIRPVDDVTLLPKLSEKERSLARIERDIEDLARFSRQLGLGVTRLAFSKEETDAILWAKQRLTDFGFDCIFDPFSNLHAYDKRKANERILVGTHIDSVIDGGKYDRIVGLVSFLETLRLAKEEEKSYPLPMDFVIFRAEESTVFKVALLGSKVATGALSAENLQDIRFNRDHELKENLVHYFPEYGRIDLKPITLLDVLSKTAHAFPNDIKKGCWFFNYPKESYVGYLEIGTEQGIVLERECKDFGIVSSFRPPVHEIITINGCATYSGATPMGTKYRRDALCGACECITAIESIATEESSRGIDIVATVGEIEVPGMGVNKIPGRTSFTLDLRGKDLENRQRIHNRIHEAISRICTRRKLSLDIELTESSASICLETNEGSQKLRKQLISAIRQIDYSYTEMPSGAGHDAMAIARTGIPTAMLLVPYRDGSIHFLKEKAKTNDIAKAAKVLLETLCSSSFKDRKQEQTPLHVQQGHKNNKN
jgi:hydantoinase/carbamoylase family amidase